MPEKPKIIKRNEKREQHPLYNAFTQQIGAGLDVARKIKADLKSDTPNFVQRFLDEFDKKAV